MAQTKNEWRRALLKTRGAIPRDLRDRKSVAIAARVAQLAGLEAVRSVLGYRAIGAEVDASHVLALPAVARLPRYRPIVDDGCAPAWSAWSDVPDAESGVVAPADFVYPLLVLVPGVGFDPQGTRLGRGAGFYDRALADLRRRGDVCAVGIAFECQIVPALPADTWDQCVEWIVTEQRTIACGQRVGAVARAAR